MSKEYYRKQDTRLKGTAYAVGRGFEYRVMSLLFMRGWHVMRRFGSHGVRFCSKCMRHIPRNINRCVRCKTSKHIMKASLDLTAYKDGVYLMITCKFSANKMTVYLDDSIWDNLVTYANHYNAVPIFAGVDTARATYFTDLRTLKRLEIDADDVFETLKNMMYKQRVKTKADPKTVDWLLEEAKSVVHLCNEMLKDENIKAAAKARYLTVKVNMINVINRIIWQSGLNVSQDDLATLLSQGDKIEEELEKPEEAIENG